MLLTPMIGGISHKRCQRLALKIWWHALALVTHEITYRWAYLAQLSPLLRKIDAISRQIHSVMLWYLSMMGCRIWSCSLVPCEKHGPRDSVDKIRGRRPRFLSLLRPEGYVFHTARETMIKSYYNTLAFLFFPCFIHINLNFSALKWAIFGSLHGC